MLLCPRTTAAEALTLGLANKVVDPETLMQTSREIASGLASGPRIAYRYIKDNLDEALDIDHATAIDHEASRMLRAQSTADHKEAARAFVEKRSPNFTGT
jgi:enoyl-CoA hydratase/carnithine racemase